VKDTVHVWDRDVRDICDQLVIGQDFETGVGYIEELADLVMKAREALRGLIGHEGRSWDGPCNINSAGNYCLPHDVDLPCPYRAAYDALANCRLHHRREDR